MRQRVQRITIYRGRGFTRSLMFVNVSWVRSTDHRTVLFHESDTRWSSARWGHIACPPPHAVTHISHCHTHSLWHSPFLPCHSSFTFHCRPLTRLRSVQTDGFQSFDRHNWLVQLVPLLKAVWPINRKLINGVYRATDSKTVKLAHCSTRVCSIFF